MNHFDGTDPDVDFSGRRAYRDRGKSDRNEIVCKRCGEDGCYWWQMPSKDGMSEHPVLFNSEGRRHVCNTAASADEFEPV